jgi:hypothetical protein
MCPHKRYTLFVSNRSDNVNAVNYNERWSVDISTLPHGPCLVTVRSGQVSYPECTVTGTTPVPVLDGIRAISVHSNLGPRGWTAESAGGLVQLRELFAADMGTVVVPAAYTADLDLPARTLPALGEPCYHVPELPRHLVFERQWVYDPSGTFTSVVLPDAMDGVAYVSFMLDIEFL